MKTSIKENIYSMIALVSLMLLGAEAETAFNQILWSGSWLAVLVLSAKGLDKCEKEENS